MEIVKDLIKKIESLQAKVGVVGLGYVGSSVANAAVNAGFNTLAFDIDLQKVAKQNNKKSKFLATNDWKKLAACDVICICVPTPLNKDKSPNFNIIKGAATTIAKFLRPGQLISTESSLGIGVTRSIILPTLERTNLKVGKDFFLSTSPERIDPGNKKYEFSNIPKVVSGIEKKSLKVATKFYSLLTTKVIPVSSPEVAEFTKVLENTFRFVNISLINEVSDFAKKIGINIREVVSAASTKPFGFMPHFPSCGIGGYCIPVLPYFMLDGASKHNINLDIIKSATKVNETRPHQIINTGLKLFNELTGKKTKVLLIGVSYKAGSSEVRESVALKLWELAEKNGAKVSYHDPYVTAINNISSLPLTKKTIANHDLIIIGTPHQDIEYKKIIDSGKPIVDAYHILPT